VLFMFGLVAASTMAQSVRERTSELAVLKTLGFSGSRDLWRWCSPNRCSSCSFGGCWGLWSRGSSCSAAIRRAACWRSSCCRPGHRIGIVLMVLMGLFAGVMPADGGHAASDH
jgi:putative ABC transport system permease protein